MKSALFVSLVLVAFTGCLGPARRSLSDDEIKSRSIGVALQLTEPMFLIRTENIYRFGYDRAKLRGQPYAKTIPTFEEFRTGRWDDTDRKPGAKKYVALLEKGSSVVIVDIQQRMHIELGRTFDVFGEVTEVKTSKKYSPVLVKWYSDPDEDPADVPFASVVRLEERQGQPSR